VAERDSQIPTRTRLVGRTVNGVVARAPWLWPLLRRPVQGFFDNLASGWDERTGAGTAALFLAREFPQARVRGVDLSEEMIRTAQSKVELDPEGRIAFKVADASDLPYPDGHFDLVTHVNVPPFFSEISRVLAAGGQVIVAATGGSSTPFYTPPAVLERGFRRRGIETVESGTAGRGTFYVGRKAEG
jgi:SAM-dependent methyltransferase